MRSAETAKRVLVGDAEEHIRLTLSLVLRRAGFTVTAAGNGDELLSTVRESSIGPAPVELVVVDLRLPGLCGSDLIAQLAKVEAPPAVLITCGYLDKDMVAEAMRSGCAGYLEKPFEPDVLLERVERTLEKGGRLLKEEEMMAGADQNRSLCRTCNDAAYCVYAATATSPILHCEEFDAFQPASPGPGKALVASGVVSSGLQGARYLGLCVNCEFRAECINSTCEGGVWHCENYQ